VFFLQLENLSIVVLAMATTVRQGRLEGKNAIITGAAG